MKQADLTPIENSSNLLAQHYDAATQTLTLQFKGGKVYQYGEVPAELFAEFEVAPSKGSFFHARLRQAYAGQLIELEEE